jgi:hypothetical protein
MNLKFQKLHETFELIIIYCKFSFEAMIQLNTSHTDHKHKLNLIKLIN